MCVSVIVDAKYQMKYCAYTVYGSVDYYVFYIGRNLYLYFTDGYTKDLENIVIMFGCVCTACTYEYGSLFDVNRMGKKRRRRSLPMFHQPSGHRIIQKYLKNALCVSLLPPTFFPME